MKSITTFGATLALALPVLAGGPTASLQQSTLSPNQIDFFDLGVLALDEVAFGITTPLASVPPVDFDAPDTELATYLTDDLGIPEFRDTFFTINDDSDADNNLGEDSLGSLFRIQPIFAESHTAAVGGFGSLGPGSDGTHGESGDYLFTSATVRPADGVDQAIADLDGPSGNGSLMNAAPLSVPANGAVASINTLAGAGGDLDYYRIDLVAGEVLTLMTAPLGNLSDDFDAPDTLITVFDGAGDFLFDDDDAGGDFSDFAPNIGFSSEAFGSAMHLYAEADATYFIAISGFVPDGVSFDQHSESGDYAVVASRFLVPAPGASVVFGFACSLMLRRRR